MTRASLLQILDHVSEISDAEIRELEQLAAAFPYCQTAHILLAKAAHDRGSMLASQRLRRAATYATNRELLRQLLEQPAPAAQSVTTALPESVAFATTPTVPAETIEESQPSETGAQEPTAELLDVSDSVSTLLSKEEAAQNLADETDSQATPEEDFTAQEESIAALLPDNPALHEVVSPEASPVASTVLDSSAEDSLHLTEAEKAPVLLNTPAIPVAHEEFEVPQENLTTATDIPQLLQAESSAEPLVADEGVQTNYIQPTPEADAAELPASTGLVETEARDQTLVEDLLPPMAPPIRPPANAGISRFEFDLVEPALPTPSAYQLPGLEDEAEEENFPLPTLSKPAPPAFHADEDLGYALGAGSRLGYDLQPRDGYTLDLPLDSFFEPDALLLAHIAASRPKPTKSSIDLINRFLKTQPRIKTPATDSAPADEQADLSVRSTQAAPAIASESLAKIMVKQGKIDKAIEIYERLMQRQPEKKAYFADQIQHLKQPSA
ncbi:hypothetical protein [Hymenobacter fodinae]|uniref:Uncharacterized protein n=1 Tax=Hymenobacter fodinae TaxID=2510796 RepID=A0A4Z0P388_9BACT|nr:hypothetical protein [Hymenobacter fodinae]TGE06002.1 hypothetical protein EU556_14120 [Hymenobacter fodinae]